MEVAVEAGEKPLLPVRFYRGVKRLALDVLGKVATAEFWLKLIETIARDMAVAFVQALGGRLVVYGKQAAASDPDCPVAMRTDVLTRNGNGNGNNGSASAFSGSYQPNSSYSSDFRGGYPVKSSYGQPQDQGFPGFGR